MGRKSDVRERLLATAAGLLPQRGYTAVGVHELCVAAEVKPGSFYYFYSSKQQLVLDMLDQNWQQTRQAILDPISQSEISGLEKIKQFFLRTYEIQANISARSQMVLGCTFGNLGGELANQDEIIRHKISEIFSSYISYLEIWLSEAIEQELSSIKIDQISPTAEALLTYYEGLSLMARISKQAGIFQRLSDTVLTLAGARV